MNNYKKIKLKITLRMQYSNCDKCVDYNIFINDFEIEKIISLKVQRKKKKSYLNFMILFHLFFLCINIITFKWILLLFYLAVYLICFLFCEQYEHYIEFSYNNEEKKIKICSDEYDLFAQLENKLYSTKLIPIQFKNEPFIKSYI